MVEIRYSQLATKDLREIARHTFGSHVVFYRQDELGILVSRVLHKGMLPEKHRIE